MFDIGWSELVLIGVVALIVVGPQDLPKMFHTLGRFSAKARSMARDLTRAMEHAAKESGIDEAARDLKSMTSKKALGLDALENAAAKFEKWNPTKPTPSPKGPATQALADKLATERAARVAEAAAPVVETAPVPSEPAATPTTKPRAKTAKAAPAKVAAPIIADVVTPKPATRVRGGTTRSKKTEA
jgi:sec-independent protein translocase protein TatB